MGQLAPGLQPARRWMEKGMSEQGLEVCNTRSLKGMAEVLAKATLLPSRHGEGGKLAVSMQPELRGDRRRQH